MHLCSEPWLDTGLSSLQIHLSAHLITVNSGKPRGTAAPLQLYHTLDLFSTSPPQRGNEGRPEKTRLTPLAC